MPGLDRIRSESLFVLTDVKCYFKWGTKYEDARQEVINRSVHPDARRDPAADLTIVVVDIKGTPVRVRDVADGKIGPFPRLGTIGIDDRSDGVQGIVLVRHGGETKPTLEGIHARIDYIKKNHILPPGMEEIEAYCDRGDLVALTTQSSRP